VILVLTKLICFPVFPDLVDHLMDVSLSPSALEKLRKAGLRALIVAEVDTKFRMQCRSLRKDRLLALLAKWGVPVEFVRWFLDESKYSDWR
jgi:hypothetical protein